MRGQKGIRRGCFARLWLRGDGEGEGAQMDNATFDRLARLLAGGASRRHTVRAIIAAALTGAAAEDLLAA